MSSSPPASTPFFDQSSGMIWRLILILSKVSNSLERKGYKVYEDKWFADCNPTSDANGGAIYFAVKNGIFGVKYNVGSFFDAAGRSLSKTALSVEVLSKNPKVLRPCDEVFREFKRTEATGDTHQLYHVLIPELDGLEDGKYVKVDNKRCIAAARKVSSLMVQALGPVSKSESLFPRSDLC